MISNQHRFLMAAWGTPLLEHADKICRATIEVAQALPIPTDLLFAALYQMTHRGTVSSEDMMQLSYIPEGIYIAAEAMGVTEQEFAAQVQNRLVSASEFLPRFAETLLARSKEDLSQRHNCRNCNFWSRSGFIHCAVVPEGPGCGIEAENTCQHWQKRQP